MLPSYSPPLYSPILPSLSLSSPLLPGAPRFPQMEQTHLQMCVLTCACVFDEKKGKENGAVEGEAVGLGQNVPPE